MRSDEAELDFDGALGFCAHSRGNERDVERLRITGDTIRGHTGCGGSG